MARTTAEIKKSMTDAFLANETLREKYGLSSTDTWNGSFSSVSLENIIIFIFAAAIHVLEVIFDQYASIVDDKIAGAVVASVPWYHKIALAFQYGDALVLNETTMKYGYATEDESKQLVKYAAVRDKGNSIQILVSGDYNGSPVALSNDVLTAFKSYMNRVKIAGAILNINSKVSDEVLINAKIYVDPLVIDTAGTSLSDGSKPVEAAITNFLKSIIYGGTFNKTKLVDAIQNVTGVTDVELGDCQYKADGETAWTTISGNNYSGDSGSYIPFGLSNTLIYVVQN